jgi:Mn-containing catalase
MDEDVTPRQRLICREIDVDLPYPPIKVESPNIDYAVAMFKLYAGHDSELTATSQYLYQNMILYEKDPTSADLLECISINERAHFRILGQLIYMLGADPKYYAPTTLRGQTLRSQTETGIQGVGSNGYSWWSGEVLLYTKDYVTMIQDNLQLEYITIANYNAVQREIGDIYVQAVIERILADEYRHIEIFTDMLNTAETPDT